MVYAILGAIAAILYGKFAIRLCKERAAEEEARLNRIRRYGAGDDR